MAQILNKNRMFGSRFALILTILVTLFSRQYWTEETVYHEVFEIIGVIFVGICAMGRIYSTAFLGGHKNECLITHGIYSVLRNPLYFFTLLGVTGIALISNHISVMIGLPLFFALMYRGLINREQAFLQEKFGQTYIDYTQSTSAMFPNFANYRAPETVVMNPRLLTKSLFDAVWWLAALPIIEFIEYLQAHHVLPILFIG